MKPASLLLSLFVFAACNSYKSVSGTHPGRNLMYRNWSLHAISSDTAAGKGHAYLVFGDGGRISGFGGCSRFSGAYQLTAGKISIVNIERDVNECTFSEQENKFLEILAQADGFELNGNMMTLKKVGYDIMQFESSHR